MATNFPYNGWYRESFQPRSFGSRQLGLNRPKRAGNSRRLTVLSDAERAALYGLPDFDDFQRAEFFALTEAERIVVDRRRGLSERLHCMLQLGYFKAKQAFFAFDEGDVPAEDIEYLRKRYFPGEDIVITLLRRDQRYEQRADIAALFSYRLWSSADQPDLMAIAASLARRDVTPSFILIEILAILKRRKIVRPGYTTLQSMISDVLASERRRLAQIIEEGLDANIIVALKDLLVSENALSELAALKKDAKNFGYKMMVIEREKRAKLAPLYQAAKSILPRLAISQQSVGYYASLVHYYTVFDLRRMAAGQRHLYLLCYAWRRYRQMNDNLLEAFGHHMAKLEQETKKASEDAYAKAQTKHQREGPVLGRLLLLYVDDTVADATPFGDVRTQAFNIMPKDALLTAGRRLCERSDSQLDLRWTEIDRAAGRFKKHLRPLATTLDFSAEPAAQPWLAALTWIRDTANRQQRITQRPLTEIPDGTIPKRLWPYLYELGEDGEPLRLRGDRFEFWIYRQLRKRLAVGELYLDDSVQHRRFSDELVDLDQEAEALDKLGVAWLKQPVEATVNDLCDKLDQVWRKFDRELRQGKLKHLELDTEHNTLTWRKPRIDKEEAVQSGFYAKLPARALSDVFRHVNARCSFLSALTPLQPRYAKKVADDDSLMAVIVAQAMNYGMLSMAETSDIAYDVLTETHHQHVRLATLSTANDKVSNFIAKLDIFPFYSFNPEVLYGSVDGQKFESATPTTKARYSSKYFGRGKGVVAYTLLANHVPLETALIGANEHESHYVFDICYHNTTDIAPTTITGDMHSINKANFAVMHWFGLNLSPRFTNLQAQVPHLFCGTNPPEDRPYLIQPAAQIDRQTIIAEKPNIDRIIATLGLKEASQSTLIRRLCALSPQNKTRRAVFEFDKLVRSIYTLNYFRDNQLQRDVHRSQNRIESYHQLRSTIARVSGRKQLLGRTDLDMAISNQCGRLIANIIIAYNSILLTALLQRFQGNGDQKAIQLLRKISPVAWQHIHLSGRYMFREHGAPIDVEALIADVVLA